MPLQIQCTSCGHQGTVPDNYVGKEIQCPRCQSLLVPLTPEKMENFAAKVLFAAQAAPREETLEPIVPAEPAGPEIPFECPFCRETYQVSADLAGKKINCRHCREPSKVDDPSVEKEAPANDKKTRKKKSKSPSALVWLCIAIALFSILLGFVLGRMFRS